MCRRSMWVWKMHIRIWGLKAVIEYMLKKIGGGPCSCFPGRRKVAPKNNDEDEHRNLKTPNNPISTPTVQKVHGEPPEQPAPKREGEPQTTDEAPLVKDGFPPNAIVNKGREFTYQELAKATGGFDNDAFLGEGGFGRVYKGKLESTGQVVAVKTLHRDSVQGNAEFHVEITMLSLVSHPNVVTLIGYCSEDDKRLVVYEFMPFGSLEQHLHSPKAHTEPLDWDTRMKIAVGAARGLDYLHNHCQPRIIYRDMKPANILLGQGYHPKISDLGLAKFGPTDGKTHVSTRVMGTMGYCAPEYGLTGKLTMKSDTYSFGVVLLELVTGRKAFDKTSDGDQFLVEWAKPMLTDKRAYVKLADPRMKGRFVHRPVRKAVELALMCMNNDHERRPDMSEVVDALDFVAADCGSGDEDYEETVKEERAKALEEAKMWGEQCKQDAGKLVSPTPS